MSGDQSAQKLIFDFREKLGLGEEVTSDERERRTLTLPRALDRDEYDLKMAPARERERQQCKAFLDNEDPADRAVSDLISSGDHALRRDHYEEAHQFYLRQAQSAQPLSASSDQAMIFDPHGAEVVGSKDPHYQAVARLGLMADHLVWAGQYAFALRCAEAAIAAAAERDVTWIKLIRAHALMFSGQTEGAWEIYRSFSSDRRQAVTHWETQILRDFANFREAGFSAPLMLEVEARFSEAGWTIDGVSDRNRPTDVEMPEEDRHYLLLNPDTDRAASLLRRHGRFGDALEVYRRQAEKARFALHHQTDDARAREMLAKAELNMGQLARDALMAGKFDLGRECIRELSVESRARLSVQAVYAHLLLLTGEVAAAEEIYQRNRGKHVGGRPWTRVIWEDLTEIRSKGFATPASRRLEQFFEELQEPITQPRPERGVPRIRIGGVAGGAGANGTPDAGAWPKQSGSDTAIDRLRAICRRLGPKLHNLMRATGQEREDLQMAVDAVAAAALLKIQDGQAEEALKDCLEALEAYPKAPWPTLRQAHALAVLGKPDKARPIYQRFLTGKATPDRTWPTVLKDEFALLREQSIDPPLFAEIELALLTAQNRLGIGSVQR
jgi:tetratricopeptide (TPR) repeat protein